MDLRSSLGKVFGLAGLMGLFAVSATGCGGCDDAAVSCDQAGQNCQICDAYGCHPADPQPTSSSSSSSSGAGGAGTTTGQGGSAAGGAGGAGGAAPCDPAVTACACGANDTCTTAGTTCINGLCVPGCEHSYQCGAGEVCANGACVAGCDAQTPCAAGYTCSKGACELDPANPQCGVDKPCDKAGDVCVGGLCTTPCKANTDCGAGAICDGVSGSCIPDPSPKAGCNLTDKPCTGAGQVCESDGYCHYPCTTPDECKLIDSRFVACNQVCKTQEEVSPECGLNMPCPAGKDCISNKCL